MEVKEWMMAHFLYTNNWKNTHVIDVLPREVPHAEFDIDVVIDSAF